MLWYKRVDWDGRSSCWAVVSRYVIGSSLMTVTVDPFINIFCSFVWTSMATSRSQVDMKRANCRSSNSVGGRMEGRKFRTNWNSPMSRCAVQRRAGRLPTLRVAGGRMYGRKRNGLSSYCRSRFGLRPNGLSPLQLCLRRFYTAH